MITVGAVYRMLVKLLLIWIFIISVLTIFNFCVIIKEELTTDRFNLPPLTPIEEYEVL